MSNIKIAIPAPYLSFYLPLPIILQVYTFTWKNKQKNNNYWMSCLVYLSLLLTPFIAFVLFHNSIIKKNKLITKQMILGHRNVNESCLLKMKLIVLYILTSFSSTYKFISILLVWTCVCVCVFIFWNLLCKDHNILLVPSLVNELNKIFDICLLHMDLSTYYKNNFPNYFHL